MNKKRIGALIIAGTLAVGSGVFGTYSYFTSNAKADTSISIKVGNLKVESKNDAKWIYVPEDNKANDQINLNDTATTKVSTNCVNDPGDLDVSNIRPGDAFEKTITVKNTGSLTQDLKITKKALAKDIAPFVVVLSGTSDGSTLAFTNDVATVKNVIPNKTVTLKIRVELPGATENDKVVSHTKAGDVKEVYNRDIPNDFNLDLSQTFFDISATQPNAK
jgi:hypothetical protein